MKQMESNKEIHPCCRQYRDLKHLCKGNNIRYKTITDLNEIARRGIVQMPMVDVGGILYGYDDFVRSIDEFNKRRYDNIIIYGVSRVPKLERRKSE